MHSSPGTIGGVRNQPPLSTRGRPAGALSVTSTALPPGAPEVRRQLGKLGLASAAQARAGGRPALQAAVLPDMTGVAGMLRFVVYEAGGLPYTFHGCSSLFSRPRDGSHAAGVVS